MFSKSHASLSKPKETKPKEWTVTDFITGVLMLQPADISEKDMTLINDRVKRYNILIPALGRDILDNDERRLKDLLNAVNRAQARASKYPNVYKAIGAAISDDGLPEEDLQYLEKAAVKYTHAFNALGSEILYKYRDEDKLKQFNEALKVEAQRELSEQLHAGADVENDGAESGRARPGCSIC
jgi:glucuronate isomerase